MVVHHVEDRRERFFAHDLRLRRHFDDARAHIVGIRCACSRMRSPPETIAALGCARRERVLHPVERGAIDQRTDQRPGSSGSPIAKRCIRRSSSAGRATRRRRFVHDQPPQTRAALPGGADGGEHDGAQRQFEIGRRRRRSSRCCRRVRGCTCRTARRPSARPRGPCGSSRSRRRRHVAARDEAFADVGSADQHLRQARAARRRSGRSARSKIFCEASADSGVFSDGFQITGSPQTIASAAFQAHDRHREVERGDDAARRRAGCHVSRIAMAAAARTRS